MWYLEVEINVVSSNPSRYTIGVYVSQCKDANGCATGFVKRKFVVTCIANDETNTIERRHNTLTHADEEAYGWDDFFEVSLASDVWDATKFEQWADDAGNLNFDVSVELF
eukprot:TRINITY_DN5423_c0_g4_i1.p2 TRINITY_DN5423_c0_g4~~TRINITY_DN5423_c0_g4_i1.p2  ORF type:complete len:110 (-),score=12.37 TRINITY_DN5423_c0_g4_i1:57-386(-)